MIKVIASLVISGSAAVFSIVLFSYGILSLGLALGFVSVGFGIYAFVLVCIDISISKKEITGTMTDVFAFAWFKY